MKRLTGAILAVLMILSLCACGSSGNSWQEQYDLGIKYLEEGNYEEAIIAFTAAIEIDPKQADAYVGRGDAYTGTANLNVSADSAELPQAALDAFRGALADYLEAIGLEPLAEVYVKAAEVYVALGDTEAAIALLEEGYEATGDESLLQRADEMREELEQAAASGDFWRLTYLGIYSAGGELQSDYAYTYREDGYCASWNTNAYDWLNGMLIEQVDWPTEFVYDEAAGSVTLHYYHFGEETANRTFDWTPGSHPQDNKEATFNEYFGEWGQYSADPDHYCIAMADAYATEDSYTKEYSGQTYTVENQWDENGNLASAYTYDASGAVSGYMTLQWEHYSAENAA